MGWFYPPPPPQPPVLPSVPKGTTAMGNAPPTAQGPDWTLDELRSSWPQEQWAAQGSPTIASQLAAAMANPPQPRPVSELIQLNALLRSSWPQESWPAQSARTGCPEAAFSWRVDTSPPTADEGAWTADGFAPGEPAIFNPGTASTDATTYQLLTSWPQESWPAQTAPKIGAAIAPIFNPPVSFPSPTASWKLQLSWPQESWYAQSEGGTASGFAQLQLPPLYLPHSEVAKLSLLRSTWPSEDWRPQTSGPIGGWFRRPVIPTPFPVAHNEARLWPQEAWSAQSAPPLAAGFSTGTPGIPFVSIGQEMAIRMLWPQEAWAAQTALNTAGSFPNLSQGFASSRISRSVAWLWPQEAWPAQTAVQGAGLLAPVFVPPLAPPQQPPSIVLARSWPQEAWPAQTGHPLTPVFVPPNPDIITVPDVRGMYVYDAQLAILGAGFSINTPVLADTSENVPLGTVLAQSIPPKTLASRTNPPQITITVAAYLSDLPPQTP